MRKVRFEALPRRFIRPEIFRKKSRLSKIRSFSEISEDVQRHIQKHFSDKEIDNLVKKVRIELRVKGQDQKRNNSR